ncbi:MAG: hypothetical protein QOE47_1186, partial [Pyrinomonadaceae bacterium]|nr:hypothetical protein [Pyrinomonadaceae bacterium]
QELFGERHPRTATSFNEVGNAYSRLGNNKLSLEYLEKAIEIYRGLFGERHPHTATALNNAANTYGSLGDYKRNLEYAEKAIKLGREILGDKHPRIILWVGNLILLLANIGRRPEAFQLLEEFLSQLPKDHIHYDGLKKLEHNLLAKTIRPGFRQPSGKSRGRKGKGKKNKRR